MAALIPVSISFSNRRTMLNLNENRFLKFTQEFQFTTTKENFSLEERADCRALVSQSKRFLELCDLSQTMEKWNGLIEDDLTEIVAEVEDEHDRLNRCKKAFRRAHPEIVIRQRLTPIQE